MKKQLVVVTKDANDLEYSLCYLAETLRSMVSQFQRFGYLDEDNLEELLEPISAEVVKRARRWRGTIAHVVTR